MYKYDIIRNYLLDLISRQESEKMPTVRELMSRFSASTSTVTRALQKLEYEKVLKCRQGSGIVSLRPDSVDAMIEEIDGKSGRKIIFASVEFPSENVWRTRGYVENLIRANEFLSINYRIKKETELEDILAFSKKYESVCEGLIVFGFLGMISKKTLVQFGQLPFRVVFLDMPDENLEEMPENCVLLSSDPKSSAEIVAEYFIRCGHTRIGYLRNEPLNAYIEQQIEHFGEAIRCRGIPFGKDNVFSKLVRPWDDGMVVAQELIRDNLTKIRRMGITALFVSSSMGAFAMLGLIYQAGLSVPEYISLIGECESKICQFCFPPLTTVSVDYLKMVEDAMDFLKGKEFPVQRILYSQRLIERKSVADLN